MRQKQQIYLGDKIKTKANFKPRLADKTIFNIEDNLYEGIVIGKRGNFLLVDLKQQLPFTHTLDRILTKPTGVAIEIKNIDIIETYKIADKQKQNFVGFLKGQKFHKLAKIPKQLTDYENQIADKSSSIRSHFKNIMHFENEINDINFTIKDLEKQKEIANINTTDIAKQYDNMLKNPKIKTIEILTSKAVADILITTNDLTFTDKTRATPDFKLGAYKILIPEDSTQEILAINYKKQLHKGVYSHPCIKEATLCLGNTMSYELNKLRKQEDTIQIIHLLINFLEEPNYGEPYCDALHFMCAQKVTIRPRNKYDWFSIDYWHDNEQWDGDKFTKDLRKIQAIHSSARLVNNENEEDEEDEESEEYTAL